MIRSSDVVHGIRPTTGKVGIGDSRIIGIAGYSTLTDVLT